MKANMNAEKTCIVQAFVLSSSFSFFIININDYNDYCNHYYIENSEQTPEQTPEQNLDGSLDLGLDPWIQSRATTR